MEAMKETSLIKDSWIWNSDISDKEFRVMALISQLYTHECSASVIEMAELLDWKRNTMARMLISLSEKGFIEYEKGKIKFSELL